MRIDIFTLDPEKILRYAEVYTDTNGHREISYSFSLKKDSFDRRKVIVSKEEIKQNALNTQVLHILGNLQDTEFDIIGGHIFVKNFKKHAFILDFKEMFNSYRLKENFNCLEFKKEVIAGSDNRTIEDIKNKISSGGELDKALFFLFRNGFEVEFDDSKRIFVPYISSASMFIYPEKRQ